MELGLYSLEWDVAGDAGAGRALDALLAWHAPALGRAFVDAVTRETDLPAEAAAALEELTVLGGAQAMARTPRPSLLRRLFPDPAADPRLAVELELARPRELELFRAFALYSSAAVAFLRDDDTPEIEMYDSGQAFTFFADDALIGELTTGAGIPVDAIRRVDD